jgi:hypothetical protein
LVCIALWNLWVTPGTSGWETNFPTYFEKIKVDFENRTSKNFKIIKEI